MIVRFGAIGDIVQTLPLLIGLRTRFPHSEIAWLVEDATAPLLHGHWALDRLIIVQRNWIKSFSNIRLLRRRLRAFAPEVTIDVQGTLKSSFAARISNAKCRVGFAAPDGREGSRWINNIRVVPNETSVIQRNMQLLEPFGVRGCSVDFDLPGCEMDSHASARILHQEGLHGNFAILGIGALWRSKYWREDRFATVARYLLEQWNLPSLVLWNGPEEQKMADIVVQAADGAAFLAPMVKLGEMTALIRKATLFIGPDAGPLHIAAAVGTRCVGLYGPTSLRQYGPYGPANRTIQVKDPENGSRRFRRTVREPMDAISTQMVCNICDEVLQEILSPGSLPMTPRPPRKNAA